MQPRHGLRLAHVQADQRDSGAVQHELPPESLADNLRTGALKRPCTQVS